MSCVLEKGREREHEYIKCVMYHEELYMQAHQESRQLQAMNLLAQAPVFSSMLMHESGEHMKKEGNKER